MASEEETAAEVWGASAGAWARAGEKPETGAMADAAAWMLEAAELKPGEHVLELACGAGTVGLQAAELVIPGGIVVCSDLAEPMVRAVRERSGRLGLKNVEAWVADAARLELRSGERFAVVLCRFGFMLVKDPLTALRESHRALRPEGRLALAVWGDAASNRWLSIVLDAVLAHFDAPAPKPGSPGPFALADPGHVESLLVQAGFAEISTETTASEQAYASRERWWEEIREVSGPLAAVLGSLPAGQREAIRERCFEAAGDFAAGDGALAFPAEVVLARAVRPLTEPEPLPED